MVSGKNLNKTAKRRLLRNTSWYCSAFKSLKATRGLKKVFYIDDACSRFKIFHEGKMGLTSTLTNHEYRSHFCFSNLANYSKSQKPKLFIFEIMRMKKRESKWMSYKLSVYILLRHLSDIWWRRSETFQDLDEKGRKLNDKLWLISKDGEVYGRK